MATPLFCCSSIQAYRPQRLFHESKFTSFIAWATFPRESQVTFSIETINISGKPHAIQLVRQANFGPLESTRYFVPSTDADNAFSEIEAHDLIRANFQKLNTYKNYKCSTHNKFYEINVYQKDPVNQHHWRANLARPADVIDLQAPTGTGHGTHDSVDELESSPAATASERIRTSGSGRETTQMGLVWDGYGGHSDGEKDFTACDQECGYCGSCDY